MSASSDRRKRQEAISAGTDRKTLAAMEEEKKQRQSKAKWTFGSIVVALLIAAILILNSNLFYTGLTAVKIGDVSYNTAQFDYYFKNQYYNFQQQYGSYASLFGLDTSKPLKSQTCTMLSDGGTWYDYFQQQTVSYMTQLTALSEYAKQNNIALDDTEKASIDSQMESYATGATNGGYSSTKNYLVAVYGRGCSEKLVRAELERYALAAKAYNTMSKSYGDALKATDLETYYQEHKDSFDLFDYNFYLVSAEKVTTATASATDATATDAATATDTSAAQTAVTAETMAKAKTTADAIAAAAKSGAASQALSFDEAVKEATGDSTAAATTQTGVSGSSITDVYADWLKDASRKAGDVTVVESSDTGYYVVEYVGRSDNHYKMAEARHILIKAVASDDGTYTDEAKATAKASAQKIYDEWKNGEHTEDSFASLATQYSEDTGSASNGGLYDSIYKNEMVTEFNDFVFAADRKPGDTALVYGESSGYAGYHVVYYVGLNDMMYSSYLAKNAIVNDKLTTWEDGLTGNYTATTHFSLRFASVG